MVAIDIGSRKFQRFAVSDLSLFSQAQSSRKDSADNVKVRVALQRASQLLQAAQTGLCSVQLCLDHGAVERHNR